MTIVTFPLVNDLSLEHNSASAITRTSKITNGYLVLGPDEKTFMVEKRPGLFQGFSGLNIKSNIGNNGDNVFFINSSNHFIYNNSDTGNMANLGDPPYSFGFNGNQIYIRCNPSSVTHKDYVFNILTFTLTEIVDVDHPNTSANLTNSVGAVPLDGYWFICTGGPQFSLPPRIYNSDLGSATSWVATNFIEINTEPGIAYGLAKHHNHIVVLGERSIEFFYDAGNPSGSPLARRNDVMYRVGVSAAGTTSNTQNTFVCYEDDIYFIGRSTEGSDLSLSLYRLRNFQLTRTSNTALDHIINSLALDIRGVTTAFGKKLIVFGSDSSSEYFLYDWDFNYIYVWTNSFARGASGPFIASTTTIYSLLDSLYQDNGANYEFSVVTEKLDKLPETLQNTSGKIKFCKSLKLAGNRPSTTSNVDVSWSDDDYKTFTTSRSLDISSYENELTRLGKFSERAFKVSYTGSLPQRWSSLELDIDVGMR
jgi:hypothetical protein